MKQKDHPIFRMHMDKYLKTPVIQVQSKIKEAEVIQFGSM